MNRFFAQWASVLAIAAGIFAFGEVAGGPDARAFEGNSVVTIDSVQSTATISNISISSSVVTDVIVTTVPLYRQVCVQNVSTNVFLVCGENANISTTSTSNNQGEGIAALVTSTAAFIAPRCFEVVAGNRFYCRSGDNIPGPTRAIIKRKR